jgi:DNA-binding MarR family transcriptional regulator
MVPISLPEFADKLSKLLPEIARGTLRREAVELSCGHITMPQFLILNSLEKDGETRMTDIARTMGVTTAAATGIVDRLVKGSYVQRVYDSNDRRIIKIKLSSKGRELVQRICKQKMQGIIEVFGKIPSVDRENFLKILMRVHEIVLHEEESVK